VYHLISSPLEIKLICLHIVLSHLNNATAVGTHSYFNSWCFALTTYLPDRKWEDGVGARSGVFPHFKLQVPRCAAVNTISFHLQYLKKVLGMVSFGSQTCMIFNKHVHCMSKLENKRVDGR
jgi:hypothetical protein